MPRGFHGQCPAGFGFLYLRLFKCFFLLSCAAAPWCSVSVKLSMKGSAVGCYSPFCPAHLAARREAPIITATDGKKPHSSAQLSVQRKHFSSRTKLNFQRETNWPSYVIWINWQSKIKVCCIFLFSHSKHVLKQKIAWKALVRPLHSCLDRMKISTSEEIFSIGHLVKSNFINHSPLLLFVLKVYTVWSV